MSNRKLGIVLAIVLCLLIAGFAMTRMVFMPQAQPGAKAITFEVTHSDGTSREVFIRTVDDSLADALMLEGLIEGEEGPYGLWVTTVDGEKADESKHEYWSFYKSGELLNTGVSDTLIADGEHYEARIEKY